MHILERFLCGTILTCVFSVGGAAQSARTEMAPSAAPATSGRNGVIEYLNNIARQYTARRRATIGAIHTRSEAEARQAAVKAGILRLIGDLPERTPLNAKVTGVTQADGFRIEKILFESQPGLRVTALLYVPDDGSRKRPAILISPGHSAAGKLSDYSTAAMFARSGFVVLSYDPIGQGERLQYPDPAKPDTSVATRPTGEHSEAGLQPSLIGDTVARYMLWDAMRAVDYLQERPEVDPKRIGAFGCSGGGAMTAYLGALDSRIAAIGVACYITSFDALLPSLGPQDGEQSIPHFIASGYDFADWIEAAAPRPYAVISTYGDMFPFEGARASVIEARQFYSLFDAASLGLDLQNAMSRVPPVPAGPALNPDTTSVIPRSAALQFITGPGGHGALGPILGEILNFFTRTLRPDSEQKSPSATLPELPKAAFQVTPTGQVATSYPDSETVFSLNRKRADVLLAGKRPAQTRQLAELVGETLGTTISTPSGTADTRAANVSSGEVVVHAGDGFDLHGRVARPAGKGPFSAVILLLPDSGDGMESTAHANQTEIDRLLALGNLVLAITPRPSPAGIEEAKSPLLGAFYFLGLRAQLVNRTLLGMRVDDVRRITDYLASRPDVDARNISGSGSGHMGLVLLHAAVLDSRLRNIAVRDTLTSYRSLLDTCVPADVSEDIVPGVVLRYDIADLIKALGARAILADSVR